MAARPPQKVKQLALPFAPAELHQRVTPVLPPGLKELAEAEKLPDGVVRQLESAYYTMRGRKPATAEEWRPIYAAIKPLL